MGSQHHIEPSTNPFLQPGLDGVLPLGAEAPAASFAVHDEGGVYGLYLAPACWAWLGRLLDLPEDDVALLVDGATGAVKPVPWGIVGLLGSEVEVVHLPRQASSEVDALDLPVPLLADPNAAVPAALGSRVAVSMGDGCHCVVLTRERDILVRCVHRFVTDFVAAQAGADERLPDLARELVGPLVAPLPDDAWQTLHLDLRRRYWTLDILERGAEGQETCLRWVTERPGGRWRAGWSW